MRNEDVALHAEELACVDLRQRRVSVRAQRTCRAAQSSVSYGSGCAGGYADVALDRR